MGIFSKPISTGQTMCFKYYGVLEHLMDRTSHSEIFAELSKALGVDFEDQEINYGSSKSFDAEKLGRVLVRPSGFSLIMISDKSGDVLVSISRWNEDSSEQPAVCEVAVQAPLRNGIMADFIAISKSIMKLMDVRYGYGRLFDYKFDLTSEEKLKKTLFGSYVVTVRNPFVNWMFDFSNVLQGLPKGVYPVNLMLNSCYQKSEIQELFGENPGKKADLSTSLSVISVSGSQLVQLKQHNPEIAEHIYVQ